MCRLSWNLGASTSWNPLGLSRPAMWLLFSLYRCNNRTHCVPKYVACFRYILYMFHFSVGDIWLSVVRFTSYRIPVYTYVHVCRCDMEVVRPVCLFTSDFCPISFLLIKLNATYVPACHSNRITVTCAVKVWADVWIFFSANHNVFHVERKLVYLIATPCVEFSAAFSVLSFSAFI